MWSQQERTFENFFYRDIYLLLTSCQLINKNPFTYELLVPILHQDTFVQMVLRGITYLPLLILVMAVMGGLLCIIGLLPFADRNKGIGHEYDCNELFGR